MADKVGRPDRTDRSRISPKHQVTIPVDVLRSAGPRAGDTVRFESDADGVRLVRVEGHLDALIGTMPGLSATFDLDAERDAWAG